MQLQSLALSELQSEVTLSRVVKMTFTVTPTHPAPGVSQALSPQLLSSYRVAGIYLAVDSAQTPHAWIEIAALRRGPWQGGAMW